jgi:SynChlorMet cassette radical SAM/SPASM protein ScmF
MSNKYPLNSLFLYLTDRCNLRCSHCWISPQFSDQHQDGIPIEPLKKAIRDAKNIGLQSVKLTGGEPLLYREFDELLYFLAAEALSVNMETNGTLIDKERLAVFKKTGISQISVSFDAGSADIHDAIRGVNGCFDRGVEGLEFLSDSGINLQVIMTLQHKNRAEIPAVMELCKKYKISSLKINHLLPAGRAKNNFERGENLELEELQTLYGRVAERRGAFRDLDIFFDLPVAFRTIDDITRSGACECAVLNILGILSNGDISICGIGQAYQELRMGNITRDSIPDVWRRHRILKDLRRSLPANLEGICRDCIFKFQCLGACRANAYAVNRNLYAPYFLCQRLSDANGFPASRRINTGSCP